MVVGKGGGGGGSHSNKTTFGKGITTAIHIKRNTDGMGMSKEAYINKYLPKVIYLINTKHHKQQSKSRLSPTLQTLYTLLYTLQYLTIKELIPTKTLLVIIVI